MNRRNFFLSTISVALAGALPASLAASALAPDRESKASALDWRCLEDCRSQRGRRLWASGPIEGELRLEQAEPAGAGRQFIATFEAPIDAPEGLYRIESGPDHTELFLQTVHETPGKLQAVFSLID